MQLTHEDNAPRDTDWKAAAGRARRVGLYVVCRTLYATAVARGMLSGTCRKAHSIDLIARSRAAAARKGFVARAQRTTLKARPAPQLRRRKSQADWSSARRMGVWRAHSASCAVSRCRSDDWPKSTAPIASGPLRTRSTCKRRALAAVPHVRRADGQGRGGFHGTDGAAASHAAMATRELSRPRRTQRAAGE